MYKFRYRSIENKDFKKTYYNGFMGVICESCGAPIIFKSKYEITGTKNDGVNPIIPKTVNDLSREYIVTCKECGKKILYVSDKIYNPNVVELIAKLNSKGYNCKGAGGKFSRFDSTDFNPRIWFEDTEYIEIFKKYPLPSDWVVEEYEYDRGNLIIGFKYDKKVPAKEFDKRIEILNQWINSLPVNI